MGTVWVLVIVMVVHAGQGGGPAAVTIDFDRKQSCLNARAAIVERKSTFDAYCVPVARTKVP